MAVWQQSMPQFPATTPAEQQIKSYLIMLNSALDYAFHNLDSENMTGAALTAITGGAGGAKEVAITEADKQRLEELRNQLRKDILAKAREITHEYQSAIEQSDQSIRSEVSEGFIARSGDVDAGNAAELMELVQSQITQTSDAWTARFSSIEQAVGDVNEYVQLTETYIRLTEKGIEIGMLENNEQAPYSVLLGNEKMSFFQYGVEVAYFQYNKLYVTSAEFLDRFSVGSAANGGFFEFVTTPQGLGIKWRDA